MDSCNYSEHAIIQIIFRGNPDKWSDNGPKSKNQKTLISLINGTFVISVVKIKITKITVQSLFKKSVHIIHWLKIHKLYSFFNIMRHIWWPVKFSLIRQVTDLPQGHATFKAHNQRTHISCLEQDSLTSGLTVTGLVTVYFIRCKCIKHLIDE